MRPGLPRRRGAAQRGSAREHSPCAESVCGGGQGLLGATARPGTRTHEPQSAVRERRRHYLALPRSPAHAQVSTHGGPILPPSASRSLTVPWVRASVVRGLQSCLCSTCTHACTPPLALACAHRRDAGARVRQGLQTQPDRGPPRCLRDRPEDGHGRCEAAALHNARLRRAVQHATACFTPRCLPCGSAVLQIGCRNSQCRTGEWTFANLTEQPPQEVTWDHKRP